MAVPCPRAFIFLNGDFEKPARRWPERPSASDLVIGADGGGAHLAALDWPTHVLVGDFDSLDPARLTDFAAAGTEIFRHPAAKDETDFELALEMARRRGYENIEVLGALGGRWDMTIGNLLLPSRLDFGGARVCFRHGPWSLFVLRGPARLEIPGAPGELVSLMPLGADARGITLSGCRYPLAGETLKAGFSRGLSNELTAPPAALTLAEGLLLAAHRCGPDGYGEEISRSGRAPLFPL